MSCPLRRGATLAALSLSLLLAACGGGTSNKYSGSTLDGQVLMDATAPVTGSYNVCLYAIANGQGNPLNTTVSPPANTGTLLTTSCISTDSQGQFSQALPNFYGPVLVQITGGSYANRASGTTVSLNALSATNAALQAVAFIGGGGTVNVLVTPLTTIATSMAQAMAGGLSMSNYALAASRVAGEFQLGATQITSAPNSGDPQDLVLRGVEQYLVSGQSVVDDPNAANLLTWNTGALGTLSTDYTSAYNTINSPTQATFVFY